MSLSSMRIMIGISGAMLFAATSTDAQAGRRFGHGHGVHVVAPFVRVDVSPHGATSVRAPFVAVDPGRVVIGPHRYYHHSVEPAYVVGGRYAEPYAVAPGAAPIQPLTVDELAALDEVALFAELRGASAALDGRLSRLSTGDGWRRHLGIDPALLGERGNLPEVIHVDKLQPMLVRFDKVASNPKYAKIANFPSFGATRLALAEVIRRFDGSDDPESPATDENINANVEETPIENLPALKPEPDTASGERSILKRR